MSRLLEEQSRRIAVLEAALRKQEGSSKRSDKLEERLRGLERMEERLKGLEREGEKRRDEVKRVEKRVAEEEKRRTDMESWVEEEGREKGMREERERRDRELREAEEKRERERREAEDKKERAEWKRLQGRWAETDRERDRQWADWTARWERERERERGEREAREKELRAEWGAERRLAVEREGGVINQLQLHSDVLMRVDRRLMQMEQMIVSGPSSLSRQSIVDIIGFDAGET